MTNDNNTRKKVNAIFFSIVMVLSMAAVGFAAAPAAASTTDVVLDEDTVTEGDDVSGDVEIDEDAATDGDTIFVVIDTAGDSEYDPADPTVEVTVDDGAGTYSFTGLNTDGVAPDTYSVQAVQADELNENDGLEEASASLTIESAAGEANPDPQLDKRPLHFADATDGEGQLELAFNDSVVNNDGTVTIYNQSDDAIANFDLDNAAVDADADSGQVLVDTSALAGAESDGIFPRVGDVEVNFDNVDDNVTSEARFLGQTIEAGDDTNVFQGTQIAIVGDSVDFNVEITSDSVFATRSTGDNSQIARFNTADRALEEYNVSAGSNAGFGGDADFQLRDLGLDVDIDDLEITTNDDIEGTVSATDSDRNVDVDLVDDDGDIVETQTIDLGIDAEADFEFDVDDAGDYEVEATDLSSGASVTSDTIVVSDAPDGDVEFEDSFITEEQGDIAEITITFEGDQEEAFLRVGDEEEVGYEANITVDSEGADSVTLGFNTYAAGDADEEFVTVVSDDGDITVEDQTTFDSLLATGSYPMDLSDESHEDIANDDNVVDVGDLEIEDRAVDDFLLWTASEDVFDTVLEEDEDDRADAIVGAVEDGNVQETDSITSGDVLVHDLQASGLEGMIETGVDDAIDGDLDSILGTLTESDDEVGADLRIRQTSDTTPPNADRKRVDVTASADAFDVVEAENRYFLVVDPEEFEFESEDAEIEDDDAFNVRLRVKDERLLNVDEDELEDADGDLSEFYEVALATFSFQDAEGDFDEPVEVEGDSEQTITGTSNVAPGQELTVRVRSAQGVSPGFVLSDNEVTVDTDGTFEANLDFSGASVNDEFTATVRQATFDADADGVVVEGVDDGADDDGADDDGADDDGADDDGADDDGVDDDGDADDGDADDGDADDGDADDGETEDDTPGFGAVVALIALIAAALLATRRTDN